MKIGLHSRKRGMATACNFAVVAVLGAMTCLLGGYTGPARAGGPGSMACEALAKMDKAHGMPAHCRLLGSTGPGPEVRAQFRGLDPKVRAQLGDLFRAVLPFHSFDVAQAAGWNLKMSECVESPMGGMGYHYGQPDELGNGTLSLLRPEVLLYGPTEDGSREFLGVEYIIPAPLWGEPDPPEFLGQVLEFNPEQDIWALHVWIGRSNPAGIFESWNPEVSCEFAND